MKMAKPSAQDVKAAEELLHVLQLIAAWGGPWPNPAAGENLCELLNNGEIAFDYANTTHLQTLYNNLARLQRTACPARVISGMCHVIMYEKNEILDPSSDCIDLHPRFAQLALDANRYRWLRARDLDTITCGGVFAGQTPDNLVLNLEHLDTAIDAAMAAQQASEVAA